MSAESHRYPRYKRATSAVILLTLALWAAYLLLWPNNSRAAGTGIPVGSPAPDFELKTIDGQAVKLSDFKGKPVVLNFFATWCASCKTETPLLESTYEANKESGLVILSVDINESNLAIKRFQETYRITFPIVVDRDESVTKLYDIVPLPTTYFVDREGIVRYKWTGGITKEQMPSLLKKIQ